MPLLNFPTADFISAKANQRFLKAQEHYYVQLQDAVVKANHDLREASATCSRQGCTSSTCRLFRGCLLLVVKTLDLESGGEQVQLAWKSVPELCQYRRFSLLHAAATYARHTHLLVGLHFTQEVSWQPMSIHAGSSKLK